MLIGNHEGLLAFLPRPRRPFRLTTIIPRGNATPTCQRGALPPFSLSSRLLKKKKKKRIRENYLNSPCISSFFLLLYRSFSRSSSFFLLFLYITFFYRRYNSSLLELYYFIHSRYYSFLTPRGRLFFLKDLL